MQITVRRALTIAGCAMLGGCFHQVVSTGLAPGATKVEKPWTSTFIFGLIEAKPINVQQECPRGVAFVESKFTVMNWLGTAVTFGIWYPYEGDLSRGCVQGDGGAFLRERAGRGDYVEHLHPHSPRGDLRAIVDYQTVRRRRAGSISRPGSIPLCRWRML